MVLSVQEHLSMYVYILDQTFITASTSQPELARGAAKETTEFEQQKTSPSQSHKNDSVTLPPDCPRTWGIARLDSQW